VTPQGTPGATSGVPDKRGSCACRGGSPFLKEITMDAKYNWLIDNGAIRLTLNTIAFALWIAMAVGLMELAIKI
jgi:hypothetical protein